jgi:hypothetical protein
MSQMNLATLLAEATKTEPILEVIGFILVFGSFFLAIFFIYQLVYYSIILGKFIFGSTQKSKSSKIAASPWVSIPVALVVGGIILYLLAAYKVIDLSGLIDGISGWFISVFTKR